MKSAWLAGGAIAAAAGILLAIPLAAGCGKGSHPVAAEVASEGGPAPLESQPPAMIAAALAQNASSSRVVFDPVRGGVWTANGDVGTISYVDVDEGARGLVQEIPIGGDVRSVALSPDGVFVAAVDRIGAAVTLVDAASRQVRRVLPLGTHPRACVWDASDPRWLYVAVEDDGTVAVIDRTLGVVSQTIAVGRLPSGLAVSGARPELYVTRRIDADLMIVDLGKRVVSADVAIADEPFSDPKTPNGKPFGFEAPAVTGDGEHVWLPHELLAPTHPFVFDETLFPAISVVDAPGAYEVPTDPATGRIDGRKNLFDAIAFTDSTGQNRVFSQICAIVVPNVTGGEAGAAASLVGWALACGSEDLLKFDVTQGRAVEVVDDLPGDHPVGLAVDDTAQRLFVLEDQSHQLLTFDTANASIIGHTQIYGDPIATVGKDPIDPALRMGRTLFFRANASKGTLATTGNNWMSCGGCHLDGFGSNNLRLFEALVPPDPAKGDQTGHAGLVDQFASAATPDAPGFNPHDVLVALRDQGGLQPDRTGTDTNAVDPGAPTPDATQMARDLAHEIANDLPNGPAWLVAAGGSPNLSWDTTYCGRCHPTEYAGWSQSVHAHSAEDPMFLHGVEVEQNLAGQPFTRLCVGCHDPVSMRAGDASLATKRGVTCLGCHDVDRQIRAGGNADLEATPHDWSKDHKQWALASLDKLRQPEFCGGCHQQFVPGTALVTIGTLDEYHASTYPPSVACIDCHMRRDSNGIYDHRFPGGNVYLGTLYGDTSLVLAQKTNLTTAITLAAQRTAGGVLVTVSNIAVGHAFPTGVTDIHEAWIEVDAKDAAGNLLAAFDGPASDGSIPASAARLGIDIARSDGTVLLQHELTEAARVPFDVRVPAGEAQALFVPVPDASALPAATASLDAVLYYRNVRTPFYRAASGDATGHSPDVEIARAPVR
ncbi:MAG TPA: multiheme c-type cytochrome [Polyangiaceae bacterium]|nr:multiheme c-type cytochrome [Polyangiaceae bacterium]